MSEVVVAVDIGGTKTVVALTDRDREIIASASAATPARMGPAAIISNVANLAMSLLDASSATVVGIGIATAGVVDPATGVIISSTRTLEGWAGAELAAEVRIRLADRLPVDCVIEVRNDVDAHAMGEFLFGVASEVRSALVIAVGTGIGAGIIVDGRVLRGAHHVAGEFAHMPVRDADGLLCTCGRIGHLEAIGSGVGVHRRYLALGGSPRVTSAREVAQRAQEGEERAARAVVDAATAVGRAIAGAVTLLDPEMVVVTGGISEIGDAWWRPMREVFRAESIDALHGTPLMPGRLAGHAPLRGAAAIVWSRLEAIRER